MYTIYFYFISGKHSTRKWFRHWTWTQSSSSSCYPASRADPPVRRTGRSNLCTLSAPCNYQVCSTVQYPLPPHETIGNKERGGEGSWFHTGMGGIYSTLLSFMFLKYSSEYICVFWSLFILLHMSIWQLQFVSLFIFMSFCLLWRLFSFIFPFIFFFHFFHDTTSNTYINRYTLSFSVVLSFGSFSE